jgi:hypothetical protein
LLLEGFELEISGLAGAGVEQLEQLCGSVEGVEMLLGVVDVMGLLMTLCYGQESNRNRLIDPLSMRSWSGSADVVL